MKRLTRKKGVSLRQYGIAELEAALASGERINKAQLAERIAARYPILFPELQGEKRNKNPYHMRMFEAVALAALCHQRTRTN